MGPLSGERGTTIGEQTDLRREKVHQLMKYNRVDVMKPNRHCANVVGEGILGVRFD